MNRRGSLAQFREPPLRKWGLLTLERKYWDQDCLQTPRSAVFMPHLVEFACEALWSQTFVCWEFFVYWFNLLAGNWCIQMFCFLPVQYRSCLIWCVFRPVTPKEVPGQASLCITWECARNLGVPALSIPEWEPPGLGPGICVLANAHPPCPPSPPPWVGGPQHHVQFGLGWDLVGLCIYYKLPSGAVRLSVWGVHVRTRLYKAVGLSLACERWHLGIAVQQNTLVLLKRNETQL